MSELTVHPRPSASAMNAPHGRMANRDRFADLKALLETESPVVVDGGANVGAITDILLANHKYATIHAFEPIPEIHAQLTRKFRERDNVIVYPNALGAVSTDVQFRVLSNRVSSSILEPSAVNRKYHGSKMDLERCITVPQVRLDVILPGCGIDLLKLDLQGYELEALRGAEQLLPDLRVITTEVSFVSLYEGQALFADIDSFLRAAGFHLFNLYELFTQPDGRLTAGDAIYLNSRHFRV